MEGTPARPDRTGALNEQQFEHERRRAASELQHPRPDPLGTSARESRPRFRGSSLSRGNVAPPLAALLLCACLAGGLALVARIIPKLHKTRIGATRTPAPGSREVRLSAGKYIVYYEAETTGNDISLARPHGVTVRIETPSHEPLPLRPYAGNFDTGSTYVDARAFLTVQIPRQGSYRITVMGQSLQPGASAPRIVLGVPTGHNVLELVAAGILATLAFIGLCMLLPAWWARRTP